MEKENQKTGFLLKKHKLNINKSIASILILNTLANTLGAAGVGAQAGMVFGSTAVFYVSIILTFAILFFSEIIPKTIGALYWKELAPIAAYVIRFLIWLTYPVILMTLFVTNRISKNKKGINTLSKAELLASTLLSEDEGVIDEKESDLIENVLLLDEVKIKDILTPRSVVFALEENKSIKEIMTDHNLYNFSRIPIYDDIIDNITGIVLTKKIFYQATLDDSIVVKDIKKEIFSINKNIPVSKALDHFIKRKEHMFLVVDSYGQTEGIITLEDIIEEIVGEISDEFDKEMQQFKFKRISDKSYLFEAKTPLNDFCKILDINDDFFDELKGESDSIGGLILELVGEIPSKGRKVTAKQFEFEIVNVDSRKINEVKVKIDKNFEE